ncbi:MAG: transcription elongation factor GreA [Bacilli bacterium]|nr:transcription elongation factor GreA [Bacilli bacterium]
MSATKKEYILTLEGKQQLEQEYRHLLDVERPEVLEQLTLARSMGDLSENADYDAARDRQGKIESRIAEIEEILNNVKILDTSKKTTKTVTLSSTVKYKEIDTGDVYTVKIVSSIESDPIKDPDNIKISNECALGAALLSHKIGDVVKVKANFPYEVEILEIK